MLLKYLNVENVDVGYEDGMYFMFIWILKNILCISLYFLKKMFMIKWMMKINVILLFKII